MLNWYLGLNWKIRGAIALLLIVFGAVSIIADFTAEPGTRVSARPFIILFAGLVLFAFGGQSQSEKKGYRF